MSRPNPYVLTGVLLVFIAIFGGFSVMQGGLYLDTHEGDSYHHLDILLRMQGGLRPHSDFMTPLGILAFLPVVWFMQAGFGVGMAFLWAQVAVALILWPVVAYSAISRLPRRTAYAFGVFVLGLVMALTYAGITGVSISMHYNRWAWAVSFVMLALAVLPARGRRYPAIDGVFIGLLAAGLLLLKITFFVCLLPPVVLALLWRDERVTFVTSLVVGCLAVLAATIAFGPAFWLGYLNDLRTVTGSTLRPFVGVPFDQIVAGPQFLAGTVVAILAALLLRNAGAAREGTILLVLLPAFFYITYQNFANDPKWLVFLPVMLMALRPPPGHFVARGVDLSDGAVWLSVAAVALFAPSLINLGLSPVSHAAIQSARFLPMTPMEATADVFVRVDRAHTTTAQVHLDETSGIWAKYAEDAGRGEPLEVAGAIFAHCELSAASRAFLAEIAGDLESAGVPEGSQFYTADVLTAFWLFGPFDPLEGGAPWYYGNLSGLENADYVLVPKCSFLTSHTRIMVQELDDAGIKLELDQDRELYGLYRVSGQ